MCEIKKHDKSELNLIAVWNNRVYQVECGLLSGSRPGCTL